MSLRKIYFDEFFNIMRLHHLWQCDDREGVKANLAHTDIRASLQGITFRGVDLHGADLSCADLQGADLRGADLRGANLRGAWLQGVNLQGVDLQEVYLRGANLQGADLRGAICDAGIQEVWDLTGTKWLRSDIPWWLGHEDQEDVILCDQ